MRHFLFNLEDGNVRYCDAVFKGKKQNLLFSLYVFLTLMQNYKGCTLILDVVWLHFVSFHSSLWKKQWIFQYFPHWKKNRTLCGSPLSWAITKVWVLLVRVFLQETGIWFVNGQAENVTFSSSAIWFQVSQEIFLVTRFLCFVSFVVKSSSCVSLPSTTGWWSKTGPSNGNPLSPSVWKEESSVVLKTCPIGCGNSPGPLIGNFHLSKA